MPLPFSKEMLVTLPAGMISCITLPAPNHGRLQRLRIEQTSGVAAGFSYEVYDREDACPAISASAGSVDDGTLTANPKAHRIKPEVIVAGAEHEEFGLELAYINRDEQDDRRTPNYAIYLSIAVLGTGDKDFVISYTCEHTRD